MSANLRPSTVPVAVYYVLPVISGGDGRTTVTDEQNQACKYYVFNPKTTQYDNAGSQLDAVGSGLPVNYVVLQQMPWSDTLNPSVPSSQVSQGTTLFSATAKTVAGPVGYNPLPNVFLAAIVKPDAPPSVIIPVATLETRGLILVFSVQDSNGNIVLRATFDPEIKGSTNG